jgi:hypothetical protein
MLRRLLIPLTVALAVLASACSSGGGESASEATPDSTAPAAAPGECDPVDPTECLLPWPNDRFTTADDSRPTGRRLDLPAGGMPVNAQGVAVDPAEWNRNDGFSPASIGLTVVPGVDPVASGLAPQTDLAASIKPDSNLAVVDVETGERVPAWAELDINVTDPSRQPLRIIPATSLTEGKRYAIGLSNLRRADGSEIQPTEAMAKLVSEPDADQQEWLEALRTAGVDTNNLDVGWAFTVASSDSLSGRLRSMWDETKADLGDGAPTFTVTGANTVGPAKFIEGSFDMPKYLTGDGATGTVLNNEGSPTGTPTADGTMPNPFLCVVPSQSTGPVPFIVFGHGLLGSRDEIRGIGTLVASNGVGVCAVDWLGMSSADIGTIGKELQDLSLFRTQPDRMQQGHLGFLLLGRLLASTKGFVTNPEFQTADGGPLVDAEQLSFLGASQGGILGGAPAALTDDWDATVLAVGGLGYNLLLNRSVNFDQFAPVLASGYPDQLTQSLGLELVQNLWDRGENSGYAQHLTEDQYPTRSEPQRVLILEAFGDHQVANVSSEKLARTIGAPRLAPTLAPGRSTDVEPFALIDPVPTLPWDGNALVVWDFGTPAPPVGPTPPRAGDDPHDNLTEVPQALVLLLAFIQPDGEVVDVCAGAPCQTLG